MPGGNVYGQPVPGQPVGFYGQPAPGQIFNTQGSGIGAVNQNLPLAPGFQTELTEALDYLNGRGDGSNLRPGSRQLLDQVGRSVGHSALRDFIEQSGRSGTDALGRILHEANQTPQQTGANHSQNQIRDLTNELLSTVQLTRHLSQLEQAGSPAVQRAREASLSLPAFRDGTPAMAACYCAPQISIAELLRDVRGGAFLQACELNSPLPFSGSVRISREMVALISNDRGNNELDWGDWDRWY
jgi:hypothetical protein